MNLLVDLLKRDGFGRSHMQRIRKKLASGELLKRRNERDVGKGKNFRRELFEEYINASQILGQSSFFRPEEELTKTKPS